MKTKTFLVALLGAVVTAFCACEVNDPDSGGGGNGGSGDGGGSSTPSYVVNGRLPGVFTVGQGKKVSFSMGNLLYLASEDKWAFAPKQYQKVGGTYEGNIFHNGVKSDNNYASKTYDGWIDAFLFGAGNEPWLRNQDIYSHTDFIEWGSHPISNGGNKANQWRTLTEDEWTYLFTMRKDADKKFGFCEIQNALMLIYDEYTSIYAIMLIPDSWTRPSGIAFTPLGKDSNWGWFPNNGEGFWYRSTNARPEVNVYTVSEFEKLSKSGVVFLPGNGQLSGGGKYAERSDAGYYWSASRKKGFGTDAPYADCVMFDLLNIWPYMSMAVNDLASVRLVQDVK